MPEAGHILQVIVLLLAAVISVLLFQRLKLGSILAYLVAGTAIGPTGLALVPDVEATRALGEIGVVFLLFTIGLELPFERIKVMRGPILGLGTAQIVISAVVIMVAAMLFGIGTFGAVVIGGALALSSTAVVLQLLSGHGGIATRLGRSAFGVLLAQDLAVAPFLVVILALGSGDAVAPALGLAVLKAAVAVLAILGIGRIILRYLFSPVAVLRDAEIFAALTLLVVLASAMVTRAAGLSMELGAFLAGMLLAETHYRHQVGAVIQPFRGLLLGLFFMTVGMSIDLALTVEQWRAILALTVLLLLGKAATIAALSYISGLPAAQSLHLGLLLAQGGEFAFVLFGAALVARLLPWGETQVLLVVVALSMVATPLLARLGQYLERRIERREAPDAEIFAEAQEGLSGHVIIAGFGRVGSAVAARLGAARVPFIAVDLDPHRIAQARQRSLPVFYGDIRRPEILAALHVERARSLVIAVDDLHAARELVALVQYIFPDLKIYARARDDAHARELQRLGAHSVVPEMAATGMSLAGAILEAMETTDPTESDKSTE